MGLKEGRMAPEIPRARKKVSRAYLSLIAVSFSELRKDMNLLFETRWAEAVRRRAEELVSTLAEACERQGLREVARLARSMTSLTRLTDAQALPLESDLREKFEMLLRQAEARLAEQSRQQLG
jgi:hypothetical protein